MLECSPRKFASYDAKEEYFQLILEERGNGGLESLMHVLLNYDVTDFCPTERPAKTLEAIVEQKLLALSPVQAFVHDLLASSGSETWKDRIPRDHLHNAFNSFCMRSGHGKKGMTNKIFVNQLRIHSPPGYFVKPAKTLMRCADGTTDDSNGLRRMNCWELPPLLEWRRHFEGAVQPCISLCNVPWPFHAWWLPRSAMAHSLRSLTAAVSCQTRILHA